VGLREVTWEAGSTRGVAAGSFKVDVVLTLCKQCKHRLSRQGPMNRHGCSEAGRSPGPTGTFLSMACQHEKQKMQTSGPSLPRVSQWIGTLPVKVTPGPWPNPWLQVKMAPVAHYLSLFEGCNCQQVPLLTFRDATKSALELVPPNALSTLREAALVSAAWSRRSALRKTGLAALMIFSRVSTHSLEICFDEPSELILTPFLKSASAACWCA